MSAPIVYLDVSTLLERHWTGIPVVTAEIARHYLRERPEATRFFAFDEMLRRDAVEMALKANDSVGLNILFSEGLLTTRSLAALSARELGDGVCIYPNFRRGSTRFGREVLIVHDLSFAITPELHDFRGTHDFRTRLYRDCCEVDGVFCNSQATRNDVIEYFGVPQAKVGYAHLGASALNPDWRSLEHASVYGRYVLILGTIEPRKNIDIVLRYIRDHLLDIVDMKFLFAGRDGWGASFNDLLARYGLLDCPNIVKLGFVSEPLKWAFLQRAEIVIYPSLFEGFGLPVVEAMAVGALVCAGFTSSVAELGLEDAFMFDPTNDWDFGEVMSRALALGREEKAQARARNAERARGFTWEGFVGELGRFIDDRREG